MAFKTISQFKSKLNGGGARPNLFEVKHELPRCFKYLDLNWLKIKNLIFNFSVRQHLCQHQTIGSVDVPFRGRILKVAGDRTFEPWTVTVINDEDFNVRTAFEQWMKELTEFSNNTGAN